MPDVESCKKKEAGNEAYRNGDYSKAVVLFTEAIALDPTNETFYCNRSMCYAAMQNWYESVNDAQHAVSLNDKYVKAHFRLVKGLLQKKSYKDARFALLNAINLSGDCKDYRVLDEEITQATGVPVRPKPNEFDIVEELGEGNFSKIFKALYKPTSKTFAVKVIEKATIEKTKRRHKNVNNEILMEKRVLNKLNHPNIVTLLATFQDYGSLYYQMEFLSGGELFDLLHEREPETGLDAFVGVHWSRVRFFAAEMLNALEYMHRRGIVHRDIKPENIMLAEDGHIKFVDFGTAKDLIETDLNGPEFVGTAEYMSPSTVRSKTTGIEADLWAIGVVLYQLIMGFSPFANPSPYLSFLRIKRALVRVPAYAPPELQDFLKLLLEKDGVQRIKNAAGEGGYQQQASSTEEPSSPSPSLPLSYDRLRAHGFFSVCGHGGDDDLKSVDGVRTAHERPAVRVPLLSEICLRAVGSAAVRVAEEMSRNGGIRPKVAWIQKFSLQTGPLPEEQRGRIAHYLNRRHRLHNPGVYRLFWNSVVDARSNRIDRSTWDYIGYDRESQGQWSQDLTFSFLAEPLFGYSAATSTAAFAVAGDGANLPPPPPPPTAPSSSSVIASSAPQPATTPGPPGDVAPNPSNPNPSNPIVTAVTGCEAEVENLRSAISALNRLRPKFIVVSGNFTYSPCDSLDDDTTSYETQVETFRRTMARVSETIPVLYVPGERDVGEIPTPQTLAAYNSRFGHHFYGFWYGGLRCIVINSPLLLNPHSAPVEAELQEKWLAEEIEMSKFNATHVMIFSYHPWFLDSPIQGEEEDYEKSSPSSLKEDIDTEISSKIRYFPAAVRRKWLNRLHHHKVRFIFTGGAYIRDDGSNKLYAAPDELASNTEKLRKSEVELAAESLLSQMLATADSEGEGEDHDSSKKDIDTQARLVRVRRIFGASQGLKSFPRSLEKVSKKKKRTKTATAGDASSEQATGAQKESLPSAETRKHMSNSSDSDSSSDSSSYDDVQSDGGEDNDNDIEQPKIARKRRPRGDNSSDDEEEGFVNQEAEYEGPYMVPTAPLAGPLKRYQHTTTSTSAVSREEDRVKGGCPAGVRLVTVKEDECMQTFYPVSDVPKTMNLSNH